MPFRGTYTALITPFGPNNSGIDRESLARLIELQIEGGTTGIILGGSTGEGQTLEAAETDVLLEVGLHYKGKIQILGACGYSSTQATAERYKYLASKGVDGVLISTPPYNKPPQRGLIAHFEKIAAAASAPIMLYNIPGRTAVNFLPPFLKEVWKIPQIHAVKESSGSVEQIAEVIKDCPADRSVLCGDDPLSIDVWKRGGQGTVSVLSNVVPGALAKMWKAWTSKNLDAAAQIDKDLSKLVSLLFVESNPIPTKFIMGKLLKKEFEPRLPLVKMDSKFEAEIMAELKVVAQKGYLSGL